jgi:hypothetical protein
MGASAPAPADTKGAAIAESQGNLEAARVNAKANRVSQYTPLGNLIYENNVNGDPDQWQASVELNPYEQLLYLQNANARLNSADALDTLSQLTADSLATGIDFSNVTPMPVNAGMTAQEAMLSRLQPVLERQKQQMQSDLVNRGLSEGSSAYNNSMNLQDQQMNDLFLQAAAQGIGLDSQLRAQGLQEAVFEKTAPLNLLTAAMNGSQFGMPSFTTVAQQPMTQGPNFTGAAAADYNQRLQEANVNNANMSNMLGGAMSIAGALPTMGGSLFASAAPMGGGFMGATSTGNYLRGMSGGFI